jgi:hypothetical protein
MKNSLKCNVVMIPTEEASHVHLVGDKIHVGAFIFGMVKPKRKNQHLYITSNRKIKMEEWFINVKNNHLIKAVDHEGFLGYFSSDGFAFLYIQEWHQKVESSTNPSLNLPMISQQFIFEYAYKNGEIKEVRLETYPEMTEGWVPSYNNPDNNGLDQPSEPTGEFLIKTAVDNTAIIHKIKLYTQEEIQTKISEYLKYRKFEEDEYLKPLVADINWWLENNL